MFFQPLEQFEIFTTDMSTTFHLLKSIMCIYGLYLVFKFFEVEVILFFRKCKESVQVMYENFSDIEANDNKNSLIQHDVHTSGRSITLYLERLQLALTSLISYSKLDAIFNKLEFILEDSHKRYKNIILFVYFILFIVICWLACSVITVLFHIDYFNLTIIQMVFPHVNNFELLLIFICIWYYIIFTLSQIHWENSYYRVDYLLPKKSQMFVEAIYIFLITLLVEQAGLHSERYFPMICSIFIIILTFNCIGLIPCSFALTSHILVTFTLGFSVLGFLIMIGLVEFKYAFFSNFLPKDIHVSLLPLLFFIELVSFLSRGLSLSIRLFANIMSGHTLLNILSGFLGILLNMGFFAQIGSICLIFVILVICVLEFSLAFIQAYVFTVLTCIYLKDSLHLHNYDIIDVMKEEHQKSIANSLNIEVRNPNMSFRPVNQTLPYKVNLDRRCHVSLYNKELVFRNDH